MSWTTAALVVQDRWRCRRAAACAADTRSDRKRVDLLVLTIAARLRANPATWTIPIVVLTGDDGAYARAQLAQSNFAGVFTKPCSADRLVSLLNDTIPRVG